MYFFNLKALIRDLRSNNISKRDTNFYIALGGGALVYSIIAYGMVAIPSFMLISLFFAYINYRGDGKDFILRYCSLVWVIGLRVLPFALVSGVVIGMYQAFCCNAHHQTLIMMGMVKDSWAWMNHGLGVLVVITGLAIPVYYFGTMYRSIRQVSSKK